MEKDINYYLKLNYKVVVQKIPEDEGGGYCATIPQFGYGLVGDGDTKKEALESLNRLKSISFRTHLKDGDLIPEPDYVETIEDKIEEKLEKGYEIANNAVYGAANAIGAIRYFIMALIAVPSVGYALYEMRNFDSQQLLIALIMFICIGLCAIVPMCFKGDSNE